MILILHIIIAISSIGYASYTLLRPSLRKFLVNYGLLGLTLGSGTYLTFSLHASLLRVCMTGLVYLGTVACLLVGARLRLASLSGGGAS
ncbi:MAG TPA: hypothetical protein VNG90_05600 [Candidatus Acidoferrum sp.]|nr:hypothetical protein [Candidatus Acidoferrum sp.]